MAARTLESRFERMSVNDENESVNAVGTYHKSKVSIENKARAFQQLIRSRDLSQQRCQYQALVLPLN